MREIHHSHIQRDLAALQAAENKLATAIEKSKEAQVLEGDARRAADFARAKFHSTVEMTKATRTLFTPDGRQVTDDNHHL